VPARPTPISVQCDIHPWMKAYIRVFNHPYFAVTDEDGKFTIKDAPAGEWRIVVWQEKSGWGKADRNDPNPPTKTGTPITIKAGETTTLEVPFAPPKD